MLKRKIDIGPAQGAYAHFLSIFMVLALLVAEAVLYRAHMAARALALLRRLDFVYMLAAIAVLVTGTLRVFFFGKGPDFYAANPIFWMKLGLFLVVGLLSVPPTIHYIRVGKTAQGAEIVIDPRTYRHIRGHLVAQLVVFALIPLAATLMARGIGM